MCALWGPGGLSGVYFPPFSGKVMIFSRFSHTDHATVWQFLSSGLCSDVRLQVTDSLVFWLPHDDTASQRGYYLAVISNADLCQSGVWFLCLCRNAEKRQTCFTTRTKKPSWLTCLFDTSVWRAEETTRAETLINEGKTSTLRWLCYGNRC